jgi:hypothetical protein
MEAAAVGEMPASAAVGRYRQIMAQQPARCNGPAGIAVMHFP